MFIRNKIVLLILSFLLFASASFATQTVVVGGYEFSPFVKKMDDGNYDGVTFDLISAFNEIQEDYHFTFVSTLPNTRYKSFQMKRFDLIFFEDMKWGWQGQNIVSSKSFLRGGDVYIALQKDGRDQSFFADLSDRKLIGIKGYHYGVANFNSDPKFLEEKHNFILGSSSESVIKMLEYGRGDIAIISLAFTLPYLIEYPSLAKSVLISKKLDHQYDQTILVRKSYQVTPAQLNEWLDQLEEQGALDRIWRKRGLERINSWFK